MSKAIEKYKPAGTPTESGAAIDIPEESVTEKEAIEALRRLGIVKLPKTRLSDLAALGVFQTGVGVYKMQRGQAMVNQQRLNRIIDFLMEEAMKGGKKAPSLDEIREVAHTVGYLTSKLTESQHLLVEMEVSRSGGVRDEEAPKQQTFKPGEEIKPIVVAKEVHIHQSAEAKK